MSGGLAIFFEALGVFFALCLSIVGMYLLLNLRTVFRLSRGMKPYVSLYKKILQQDAHRRQGRRKGAPPPLL